MRPRTFLLAAIAKHLLRNNHSTFASSSSGSALASVLQRHAGDVAALQRLARRLGLIFVQASKAGAIEGLVALGHGFRERLGVNQQAPRLALCEIKAGLGFVFGVESADLDHPTGVN